MSAREQCNAILDTFDESQLVNVVSMLKTLKQVIEDAVYTDIPNETTIAAFREGDEMIRNGTGQHFQGSAKEFFAMLDAEDEEEEDVEA